MNGIVCELHLNFLKIQSLPLVQDSNGSFPIHLGFPPHSGAASILVIGKLPERSDFSKIQFTEQYSERGHILHKSPHPPVIHWE